MPERPKDLDAILSAALQEAGEQGLLEGVSDADLTSRIVRLRVGMTGVLEDQPETTEEQEMQEVIAAWEAWRDGGPRPEGLIAERRHFPFGYLKMKSGNYKNSMWALPDVDAVGDSFPARLFHFYTVPQHLRSTGVKNMKLVKPALIPDTNNQSIGVQKGELGRK